MTYDVGSYRLAAIVLLTLVGFVLALPAIARWRER